MNLLPQPLNRLIEALSYLPGVGSRTAERYAYYLYRSDPKKSRDLSNALVDLHQKIKLCPMTFALIDSNLQFSPLYTDPKRDKQVIAVVAEPFDIMALEKTGLFKGTYHVLGGLLSPIDNISAEDLTIAELIRRIDQDDVQELILATNANVEGETTALYIQRALQDKTIKITRLARGLPIGIDLEYADQITLSRALEGRQEF